MVTTHIRSEAVCVCVHTHIQSRARVGFQLFIWKIICSLINNNTRINCVFCALTTGNLLLSNSVYLVICGTRCLKSAHFCPLLPVLLVMEEGVFHLLSYFLWDHQVFSQENQQRDDILCLGVCVKNKVDLPACVSCEVVQAKPHPAPAFFRQVVPDGGPEGGAG